MPINENKPISEVIKKVNDILKNIAKPLNELADIIKENNIMGLDFAAQNGVVFSSLKPEQWGEFHNGLSPEIRGKMSFGKIHEIVNDNKPPSSFKLQLHPNFLSNMEEVINRIGTVKETREYQEPTFNSDLVQGIKQILDMNYPYPEQNILGMIYSPNMIVAQSIAKILEAARIRDRKSFTIELELLIRKLNQ